VRELHVQVPQLAPPQPAAGNGPSEDGDNRINRECPICFNGIVDPLVLEPCGHMADVLCIRQYTDHQRRRYRNRAITLTCPFCRERITRGIFGFAPDGGYQGIEFSNGTEHFGDLPAHLLDAEATALLPYPNPLVPDMAQARRRAMQIREDHAQVLRDRLERQRLTPQATTNVQQIEPQGALEADIPHPPIEPREGRASE
jgi:hypothetical protein